MQVESSYEQNNNILNTLKNREYQCTRLLVMLSAVEASICVKNRSFDKYRMTNGVFVLLTKRHWMWYYKFFFGTNSFIFNVLINR